MSDEQITKRKVTMTTPVTVPDPENPGQFLVQYHRAEDYVRPDHLEAYVADANLHWESVIVSDAPDAGPGGYHGATSVPAHLDLPDAGIVYPATTPQEA